MIQHININCNIHSFIFFNYIEIAHCEMHFEHNKLFKEIKIRQPNPNKLFYVYTINTISYRKNIEP